MRRLDEHRSARPRRRTGLVVLAVSTLLLAPADSGCFREEEPARAPIPVALVPPSEPSPDQPGRPDDPPRLRARLEFPAAEEAQQPCGVLAGDLDGDGRDELCAATSGPGSLHIWSGLSPARARLLTPRTLAVGDYPLGPVWYGPFEPGKTAILVIASRATKEIEWIDARAVFAGNSAPRIVRKLELERRPRVIAAGDLGQDGTPDLALVTIDDDLVLVRGEGAVRRLRLCDDLATCALFLADGGGIVFGFQGTRRVVAYTPTEVNHANPFGFEPSVAVELTGLPRDLDELDVDGDGDTEILVVHGDRSLSIYGLAAGGGPLAGLAAGPLEIETGAIPIDLVHADFDRDGRPEIAVAALHAQTLDLFAFGAGSEVVRRANLYAGQHPWSMTPGDFDGDRALDLALANPGAQRVSVYFGDGRGRLISAECVRSGRSPHSIAAADLDRDGRPEIVALDALGGMVSVHANQDGSLAPARPVAPAPNADALATGDIDGDGQLDALFLERRLEGSVLVALCGDGAGGLTARASAPALLIGASPGDLLLVDLDGDGALEAIAADPEGGRVALVERISPAGAELRFAAPRTLEVLAGPRALARSLAPDGAIEIAVALGGPGSRIGVAWLRAQRAATGELVLAESGFLATDLFPASLAAADFDGDGADDIALLASESGGDSPGFVVPLVREEGGAWRALGQLATGSRPYRVRCGDLDGDRRDDILVSAQNSHHLNLWLARDPNEPAGPSFVRCADLGAGIGPLDLLLADLDGDGAAEIVVANAFSDELSVIRTR